MKILIKKNIPALSQSSLNALNRPLTDDTKSFITSFPWVLLSSLRNEILCYNVLCINHNGEIKKSLISMLANSSTSWDILSYYYCFFKQQKKSFFTFSWHQSYTVDIAEGDLFFSFQSFRSNNTLMINIFPSNIAITQVHYKKFFAFF